MKRDLLLFNTYVCIKSIRIEGKIICYFTMIVEMSGVSWHFRALNLKKLPRGQGDPLGIAPPILKPLHGPWPCSNNTQFIKL